MEDLDLCTPVELARELKVKKSWVYIQARKTGPESIPRMKVGKYLRFNLADVVAWLKSRQ